MSVESRSTSPASIATTPLSVVTDRGQPLSATVYQRSNQPNKPVDTVHQAVMIAPATGIKRQFYHGFALHLAELGMGVITFDFEGIGESLTCPPHKCDASLISWGRHDLSAILDALESEFEHATYHLVGHSAGGQLIGLIRDWQRLSSVFNVACSSGCIQNMQLPFKAKARFFMDVYIPLCNATLGYTPAQKIGMGEPLPKGVASQWREWCNGSGYIQTAFGKTLYTHHYDEMDTPALWLGFHDDDIANEKNLDDMLQVFKSMPYEKRMIDPKDLGLNSIGHMGFFSRQIHAKAPSLWQMAVDWIEAHSTAGVH